MQATLSSKAMVWIKETKGYKSDCKATRGLSCLVQRDGDRVSSIAANVCRVGKSLSFRTSLSPACFVLIVNAKRPPNLAVENFAWQKSGESSCQSVGSLMGC